MSVPLNFIDEKLSFLANGNFYYILSLAIFVAEIIFGCLYLLWLSTIPKVKTRGLRWLYYVYQFCFFIDLGVCIAESLLVGSCFSNVAVAYFTCLIKFVVLLLLYGLICAHRAILNLRERDKLLKQTNNEVVKVDYMRLDKKNEDTISENQALLNDNDFDEVVGLYKEDSAALDVNVAYVKEVIKILKQKVLSDDEYERLCKLDFELNSVPRNDEDTICKLNGEFEFLIKKMTEYNVCI